MAKKLMSWKTKGMNQDLSVSAFNPEFAFENMNLRLSTNESNTLLSWVNEKGTSTITIDGTAKWNPEDASSTGINSILGTPIGTAVLNQQLVLFTTSVVTTDNVTQNEDRIYKFKYSNADKTEVVGKLLYEGDLGFSTANPLETLVSYESELIQKVYWTDGINQPRVINIEHSYYNEDIQQFAEPFIFDFIPELQLNEEVKIKKLIGASGMFAPGVIQYAFTYYNKYGQESNIFYTSPLLYISYSDRGGSPEDKIDNAFKITIENVDTNFDYLRIYSIQRTSINGTPIVKRIQDIEISGLTDNTASYLDTGTNGDTVDPTELLYKGGESIVAKTMEQKDNTLFFGNIEILRERIDSLTYNNTPVYINTDSVSIATSTREFVPKTVYTEGYKYYNQLTSLNTAETMSVPCCGFKRKDYYRLGVQFQHKSGKWSDPIFLDDFQMPYSSLVPSENSSNGHIIIPIFTGTINPILTSTLLNAGYKKARGVVVFPNPQDRVVVCQGVAAPTVFTVNHRIYNKDLFAQSSWFFRCLNGTNEPNPIDGTVAPVGVPNVNSLGKDLEYSRRNTLAAGGNVYDPSNLREVEIMGDYEDENKFTVDTTFLTFHSPDIEFDNSFSSASFENVVCNKMGDVTVQTTMSSIEIQTETPTVSNRGSGFVHKSFTKTGAFGIVAGLFYDDYAVDDAVDNDGNFGPHGGPRGEKASAKWMIYPWHKDGSLNNDIKRPITKGTPTSVLKKKTISNLRFAETSWSNPYPALPRGIDGTPQLFSSDQVSIIKVGDKIYEGNIDTILMPDHTDGLYMAFEGLKASEDLDTHMFSPYYDEDQTSFESTAWAKTFSDTEYVTSSGGFRKWLSSNSSWSESSKDIGDDYIDLVLKKEGVRMKYKSTPHVIFRCSGGGGEDLSMRTMEFVSNGDNMLPIAEFAVPGDGSILDQPDYRSTMFGGKSEDAKKANIWIPCGEPVILGNGTGGNAGKTLFEYSWGDTYYQRWDCLKTYPFTKEDTNQIVEIGSFMLETHVNIDGRYDRNRGQSNNVNMSPQNFNLLNPVYSQLNNFFTYRIMDEDYYKDNKFSNQITWSKTKSSGAEVDLYTNVTLASVLELDGDKGKLNKLIRLNNYLFAFQDTGISQILYNDNVQISSTDGVPIEIANSGKVQGKDYKSNTIGCSNKWSMTTTPAGIYFMDSHDKSIYIFNGQQLQNLSNAGGFSSWSKKNILLTGSQWNPEFSTDDFVAYYDKLNQDVMFINSEKALAWSEKIQAFTSFYDYGSAPYFCNLDDTGIWINKSMAEDADDTYYLWKHQGGYYCEFFGDNKPYWMTLVGNPEPQTDKIFTNLEFRACVDGDGEQMQGASLFKFTQPFDSLETWNEYQHGETSLDQLRGHAAMMHHTGSTSSLKRKFRIWRCDIPRDNVSIVTEAPTAPLDPTDTEAQAAYEEALAKYNQYLVDTKNNIFRTGAHPIDRMRNPWLYLKLMKKKASSGTLSRAEIHDLIMTYYN